MKVPCSTPGCAGAAICRGVCRKCYDAARYVVIARAADGTRKRVKRTKVARARRACGHLYVMKSCATCVPITITREDLRDVANGRESPEVIRALSDVTTSKATLEPDYASAILRAFKPLPPRPPEPPPPPPFTGEPCARLMGYDATWRAR